MRTTEGARFFETGFFVANVRAELIMRARYAVWGSVVKGRLGAAPICLCKRWGPQPMGPECWITITTLSC